MAMPRVSNRDSRRYVQRRTPFSNHNDTLWGADSTKWFRNPEEKWGVNPIESRAYTVYSYHVEWPLFIAVQPIAGGEWVWFENSSRYSVTTSRHRTQAHPLCSTTHLTLDEMVYLDRYGYRDFMARRLNADPRQVDIHDQEAA